MSENLGDLVARARAQGHEPSAAEVRQWARRNNRPATPPHTAKARLPQHFVDLEQAKDGKEFMEKLLRLIQTYRTTEHVARTRDPEKVTRHEVLGLCQMAHDLRDNVSGSRRRSFNHVIRQLLAARDGVDDRTGGELVEYLHRTLWPEEHQREVESRQFWKRFNQEPEL